MRVEQRMTQDVVTIGPAEGLQRALSLMREHRIRHLPVVEGRRLVGIITDRDLREVGSRSTRGGEPPAVLAALGPLAVRELMTRTVITVGPEVPVEEAARLLVQHKIGCLPVVRGEELVGILTTSDLLAVLVEVMGLTGGASRIEVVLEDAPGALGRLAALVEEQGGDIMSLVASRATTGGQERRVLIARVEVTDFSALLTALEEGGYPVLAATF